MPSLPLMVCVPNFSEGRRPEVIDAVADAARSPGVAVMSIHSDPDHNRSVLSLAGPPDALVHACLEATRQAVARIDLREHDGAHPFLGAMDVIPFVPFGGSSMERAGASARSLAGAIWSELGVPCFLYEAASPSGLSLPEIRAGAFSKVAPDVGGPEAHPSAGAVVAGARPPLVAYNIELASTDIALARGIARSVRQRDGGLPHVRAMAFLLPSRGVVQVSMNLTRPEVTTMAHAFDAVEKAAAAAGTQITAAELVGLAPTAAFGGRNPRSLGLPSPVVSLEEAVAQAFGR